MRVFVYQAKKWAMEQDGVKRAGCAVRYLTTDNLDNNYDSLTGMKGYEQAKQSVSTSCFDQLIQVPGYYDIDFTIKMVQDKPQMIPSSFVFVEDKNKKAS